MNRCFTTSLSWAVIVALVLSPSVSAANKDNNLKDDIKRQHQQINSAKQKVQDARQEAGRARTAAQHADTAVKKAISHLADVRRQVEAEHDASPELKQARETAATCRERFEKLRDALIAKLKTTDAYRQATTDRDRAKEKLDAFGSDDPARDQVSKEWKEASATIRKLETAAIDDDIPTKKARLDLEDAEKKVRTLFEKSKDAVDQDKRMAEGKKTLDAAKKEAAETDHKLAAELRQLNDVEKKLHHEEQELKNLEHRQNQQNQNKNKKNKKKK